MRKRRVSNGIRAMVFALSANLLFISMPLSARNVEWKNPFTGYSNNTMLSIEKVVFTEKATEVHAVASAAAGVKMRLLSEAYLSADGCRYPIVKATKVKMDKDYVMPDSGKVHFTMSFKPLPANTRLLHFSETGRDEGWKLCNIREKREDLVAERPEEWKNVTYKSEYKLPLSSSFSDDSTVVRIKILNYTPEAGREMRLTYEMLDYGIGAYERRFPIEEDGTVVVGLHPCVPLTVLMGIGSASLSPIMVVPGQDISILMDMGDARDDFAAVDFKGAYAKMHYELNVMGAKYLVSYNNSGSYAESVLNSSDLFSMVLSSDYYQKYSEVVNARYSDEPHSFYSNETREFMEIYNKYLFLEHLFFLDTYITNKVRNVLKNSTCSHKSITMGIDAGTFWRTIAYNVEVPLFSGNNMTICPMFSMALKFQPYRPYAEQFKDMNGVLNVYNKDLMMLYDAIGTRIVYSDESASPLYEKITDPTLRAYYDVAIGRWEEQQAESVGSASLSATEAKGHVLGEVLERNMQEECEDLPEVAQNRR